MRIIAGTAGGIPLKVPASNTRPTTDRVREAVFSMLGPCVEGARVLDLFAGSGALGLEALSRGATHALFVEQNRSAIEILRENLGKTRLQGAELRQADVFRCLKDLARDGRSFDLVFADPPYAHHPGDSDLGAELLTSASLLAIVPPNGHLLLESRVTRETPPEYFGWTMQRQRDYGTTRILWLRRSTS